MNHSDRIGRETLMQCCFLCSSAPSKKHFTSITIVGFLLAVVFALREINQTMDTKRTIVSFSNYKQERYRVNETWKTIRKKLLYQQQTSKVIILAHARGGSTLCSDIFNIETDNTVLWYEPLRGFHSYYYGFPNEPIGTSFLYHKNLTRKTFDSYKKKVLTRFLIQLFDCDVESLPIEYLSLINNKSAAVGQILPCMKRHDALRMRKSCGWELYLYCYIYEHLESTVPELDSLASVARCDRILRTIRDWNPKTITKDTATELLQRFLQEPFNAEIREIFSNSCSNQFSSAANEMPSLNREMPGKCQSVMKKFAIFVDHYDCLRKVTDMTSDCLQVLKSLCKRVKLTVAEIHQMFLTDLESLIRQMPDVHIVHYVRDPRAVSVSRAEHQTHVFKRSANWTIVDEAKLLCRQMRYDTQEKNRLQAIYHDSVITVRYEDLVLNPMDTVNKMYKYFGRPVPRKLQKWVNERLNATQDNGRYGVNRANSKKHLTEWRSMVNVIDIELMNIHCRDVINEYGYDL